MLLSMTGFGEAHRQTDGIAVVVEVRTINNRYFKLTLKCGEGYSLLEPEIEAVVRQQIRRGTVQVSLRVGGGALDFPAEPFGFQSLMSDGIGTRE